MKSSVIIRNCFFGLAMGTVGLSAISCGSKQKTSLNPSDAVDGYSLYIGEGYSSILLDTDARPVFSGKTVVLDDGSKVKGEELPLQGWEAECSVNGLYKLKRFEDGKYYFLSHELDKDNKLVWTGPYDDAGAFYDELAPVVRTGDKGIAYINREGEVKLWADKVMGAKVSWAKNFLGGLSVVRIKPNAETTLCAAIDTKGNIVFQPKYENIIYVGSGIWMVEDMEKNAGVKYSDWTIDLINRKGEVICSFPRREYNIKLDEYERRFGQPLIFNGEYGLLSTEMRDHWKVIDTKGKVMFENLEGFRPMSGYIGNLAIFGNEKGSHKKFILNEKGEIMDTLQRNQTALIAPDYYLKNIYDDTNNVCEIHDTKGNYKALIPNDMGRSYPLNKDMIVQHRENHYRDKRGYHVERGIHFYSTSNGLPAGPSFPTLKQSRLKYKDIKMNEPVRLPYMEGPEEMWMPDLANETPVRPANLTHGTAADIQTFDLKGRVRRCVVYDDGYKKDDYSFERDGTLGSLNNQRLGGDAITRDAMGRITEIKEKTMNEFEETSYIYTLFTYDETGRVIKKEASSDYDSWTDVFEYDEDGRISKRKCSGGGAGDFEEVYVYTASDLNGNWVERTRSVAAWNSSSTETRSISYY